MEVAISCIVAFIFMFSVSRQNSRTRPRESWSKQEAVHPKSHHACSHKTRQCPLLLAPEKQPSSRPNKRKIRRKDRKQLSYTYDHSWPVSNVQSQKHVAFLLPRGEKKKYKYRGMPGGEQDIRVYVYGQLPTAGGKAVGAYRRGRLHASSAHDPPYHLHARVHHISYQTCFGQFAYDVLWLLARQTGKRMEIDELAGLLQQWTNI
jgi:hypothetical protein